MAGVEFIGTDVLGADNPKIGDITDILFTKDGKVDAYVVGVGGFLGIGAKNVALPPSSFQVVAADANSSYERLRLSMTKEQLQQAASLSRTTRRLRARPRVQALAVRAEWRRAPGSFPGLAPEVMREQVSSR